MKRFDRTSLATAVGLAVLGLAQVTEAQTFTWTTVVNNKVTIPACASPTETRKFNSYSQPSVNEAGLVVFRGRSKGSDGGGGEGEEQIAVAAASEGEKGQPARGVYSRDMSLAASPVSVVACVRGEVPGPNNLVGTMEGQSPLGTFNEFPAFPRIDATSPSIATRGQSTPVWEAVTSIDTTTEPPTETTTKVGTSGVYVQLDDELLTGASLLGSVKEDFPSTDLAFPEYSVPGVGIPDGTKFDQFPGGPTIADETFVAFKGNFSAPNPAGVVAGRTGVFFRDVSREENPTYLVANSFTTIPGSRITFGSTAPPSAANGYVFFVGSDNEDAPAAGGIYRARMDTSRSPDSPQLLTPLVKIGKQVPTQGGGNRFTRFGEGLSVSKDGNLVAFWGTWGPQSVSKQLFCPVDGNQAIKEECLRQYPNGYAEVQIPVNQGIFVYEVSSKEFRLIAKTGQDGFSDFLYWVFSGAPPGVGGGHEGEGGTEDREPPRWRSSAFAAVSLIDSSRFAVAFKGTQDDKPGIFLGNGLGGLTKVVQVGDPGTDVDPAAPAGSVVTALGIERDGFRGANLGITASMLNYSTTESMSGIYLTKVR